MVPAGAEQRSRIRQTRRLAEPDWGDSTAAGGCSQPSLVPSRRVAKKSRTPPPPRRVQAPARRTSPASPASPDDRRRWQILIGSAALGFLGLAAVVALYAFGSDSSPGAVPGCRVQTYPATAAGQHVNQAPPRSRYNSFPPTNGPHNPTAAPFDVYTEPVEQYRLVHNLEHGAVVIQYGRRVTPAEVTRMTDWYRDDPNGIIIAPLPELGRTIALAAWNSESSGPGETAENAEGILARCTRFSEEAFDSFMDGYAFKGPERFRKEDLTPGS